MPMPETLPPARRCVPWCEARVAKRVDNGMGYRVISIIAGEFRLLYYPSDHHAEETPVRNQRLNSPHARDVAYHVHPSTDLAQLAEKGPHVFRRGEGIHVFDDDGKRYIEGMSGLWCASLGFSEARLVDAPT